VGKQDARSLGQILTSLLKEENTSQSEVARKTGIHESQINRIFAGQGGHPFLYTLALILDELNASPEEVEEVLAAAHYPPSNTLGGAIARLILERKLQLKLILAQNIFSARTLTKIIHNKTRTRPHKATIQTLLCTIGATPEEKAWILRVGGYT